MMSSFGGTDSRFAKLLLKIEAQLEDSRHPFRLLQRFFDQYIEKTYGEANKPGEIIMTALIRDITDIVQVMCYTTIRFYNLGLELSKPYADLFLGVMTDLIVRGKTRTLVVALLRDDMKSELTIFRRQLDKFRQIRLDQLKISPYLAFNSTLRGTHHPRQTDQVARKSLLSRPSMSRPIEELLKVRTMESPNRKLGQLYAFSKSVLREIDDFWSNFDVGQENLIMDPDSLLSLFIFTIIKSEYAEVMLDHRFMELFITDVDKKSAKGYYLVTLGVAFEWIKSQDAANFSLVLIKARLIPVRDRRTSTSSGASCTLRATCGLRYSFRTVPGSSWPDSRTEGAPTRAQTQNATPAHGPHTRTIPRLICTRTRAA